MKKISILITLIVICSIIGIKFLFEFLAQIDNKYSADGLRLLLFMLPFWVIYIGLFFYLMNINEKRYALISIFSGLIYFIGTMNKPRYIPMILLTISGVMFLVLLVLLLMNYFKSKPRQSEH
jgi:hypothetical protein